MSDNAGSKDAVVIERTFNAAQDLICHMWTDPEQCARVGANARRCVGEHHTLEQWVQAVCPG